MLDFLIAGGYIEAFKNLFGEAASNQFFRDCLIFVAAAWVHSRQVRAEIKEQITELIAAFKEDRAAQTKIISNFEGRIDRIEEHLQIKGEQHE